MVNTRYFWDCEHREVVTEDQLQEEWETMEDWEQAEHGFSFENYVENCQDYRNGILEEIDDDKVKMYLANEYGEHWRDW